MRQQTGYSAGSIDPGEALGESEAFLQFQERLSSVAPVERPVLLLGERGTGKELAARRLHYLSKRWSGPFITLNCAALSPALIESELFGYERGAFTGAEKRRTGRFEVANGGTLFLDEIGNIPMEAQEKILRVVEYGSFERVGSTGEVEVDVRIVAAANVNLKKMSERGEFKRDLLDRLSFEVLFLPPLRLRKEDILLLANHFAAKMAYELGRDTIPEFSESAVNGFNRYGWPGNVRELKNVVERAVYSTASNQIDEIVYDPFTSPYLPDDGTGSGGSGVVDPEEGQQKQHGFPLTSTSFSESVREFEISLLSEALTECRYNQKKAADRLGLSYDQLRGLIRKHGKKRLGL